ncbi:hypothetical protein SAMN06297144_1085 [Sphingomonas guangdongensis]|uniref:Uncharacterized protein n=1 Tax=Sphingomonas guangdongensis TaxID=1141890 RepID=A0A285QF64_9SPHN|nr:hypothetical protein [Sphingomonas guangdongensis]SOB80486.1 hypothetical protein SAMN06297144_1085 [Sphingomonas guangdongensis]
MRVAAVGALVLVGAAPVERVIVVGRPVATTINGVAGTLLVDPGAPSMPIVSRAYADRLALKPGMFTIRWLIGPVVLPVTTAVERINLGRGEQKRRIGWVERPYRDDVDGAVGPGGLPDNVVRFTLRAPQAGERTVTLPMLDAGGLLGGSVGLFARIDVEGEPVRIRFDLNQPHTLTNAGMALTLARVHAGTLAEARRSVPIVFGVVRPVRTMTLARPLAVGPLSITRLDVRTGDFGNADGIASTTAAADPDEIVVEAKGKRDRSRDRITLGSDALARCSAIVFDKPAKQVRLTCA